MRLIDADALTQKWEDELSKGDDINDAATFIAATICRQYIIDVDLQLTIDPVKHGLWIHDGFWYDCSVCGHTKPTKWNYCPHCGAKMDGEQE